MSIDNKDLLILKILHDQPGASLMELKEAIQVRAVATVFNRVTEMEQQGLIEGPPSKKQARSRKLTDRGERLLRSNGMI